MALVWEHSQAEGTTLLVMLALADHCNDDGYCWPSLARIAAKSRISERSARRCCEESEKRGELQRTFGGRGPGDSNVYRVMPSHVENLSMSMGISAKKADAAVRLFKADKGGQSTGNKADAGVLRNINSESSIQDAFHPQPVPLFDSDWTPREEIAQHVESLRAAIKAPPPREPVANVDDASASASDLALGASEGEADA
jgi:hypothetical protein